MSNYLWDELVLEANSMECSFIRKLIEDFWPKVVRLLGEIRDIEIAHPTDKAWFHIRRAIYPNRNKIDVLGKTRDSHLLIAVDRAQKTVTGRDNWRI
ncbi:MAG TPA: hypothetical protein HPP66_13970 [Planctomycetes bacterium]|nr:hypothetical protein [Planctomycetota bacterium]